MRAIKVFSDVFVLIIPAIVASGMLMGIMSAISYMDSAILFAWVGQPDTPYITKPTGLGFWQCITVPRLLTLNMNGLLCAYPVPELARLHTRSVQVSDRTLVFPENRADILIRGIHDDFWLIVADALEVFLWAAMRVSASFNQRLPADVQKDDALSLMPKRSES